MWGWMRVLLPRRKRREPSQEATAADERATLSLEVAERHRREARRVRLVAEEFEATVRDHNAANHYAEWLRRQLREQR